MKSYLILLLSIVCSPVFAQSNLFDEENSLSYADYLTKTGDYKFAYQEYERILFLSENRQDVQVKLIDAYDKAFEYQLGMSRIEALYPQFSLVPTQIGLKYAKFALLVHDEQKLEKLLQASDSLSINQKLRLEASHALMHGQWEVAQKIAAEFTDQDVYNSKIKYFAQKGEELRYKRAGVAMALSAVVPGLGKAYAGRWKDGLISLLSVGVLGWQAYNGFNTNGVSSVYGWINGSLALGFYGGNIYGSYKAAKEYNSKLDHKISDEIENIIINNY
jgi:hypothetical protein